MSDNFTANLFDLLRRSDRIVLDGNLMLGEVHLRSAWLAPEDGGTRLQFSDQQVFVDNGAAYAMSASGTKRQLHFQVLKNIVAEDLPESQD